MKIYRLRGTVECTMNQGYVPMSVEANSPDEAFARFRRDFPGAGDPQILAVFPSWEEHDEAKEREFETNDA